MGKFMVYVAVAAAILALGAFVYVTDAPAYAGTNPSTCNNCHVMDAQYENWYHAAHEKTATCVDCHLPHDNIVHYWVAKAETGVHDVYVFSTGQVPVLIRAKPATDEYIQANCVRCHQDTVENIMAGAQAFDRRCWDCHRSVAHGDRGISLIPLQDSSLYQTSEEAAP